MCSSLIQILIDLQSDDNFWYSFTSYLLASSFLVWREHKTLFLFSITYYIPTKLILDSKLLYYWARERAEF